MGDPAAFSAEEDAARHNEIFGGGEAEHLEDWIAEDLTSHPLPPEDADRSLTELWRVGPRNMWDEVDWEETTADPWPEEMVTGDLDTPSVLDLKAAHCPVCAVQQAGGLENGGPR